MTIVGSVAGLFRFPVKSTAGEALPGAPVDRQGVVHDREWAVRTGDGKVASGKNSRRFRAVEGLMGWRSSVGADACPVLHGPGGESYRADDPAASRALAGAFGHSLELYHDEGARQHDACPVHLVSASSIRRLEQLTGGHVDARRFRANIVLDTAGTGFGEDAWVGADLAIGPEVVLRLGPGMPRCVMVDQPQAGVEPGPPVLAPLGRVHDVELGLMAAVIRTGTISLGDQARLTVR